MSKQKVTQKVIADVCGVQRQSVSCWMNGETRPDILSLAKIAKYFNLSTDYLLGLTDIKVVTNESWIAYSEGYRDGFKAAKEDIRYTVEEMQRVMKGILGEVDD